MVLKSNPCRIINERLKSAIYSLPMEEFTNNVNCVKWIGSFAFAFTGTYSLTSVCDGAVSLLFNHCSLQGPMSGICRSRHDHTNICAVFEDYWASYVIQCQAGWALAGWDHIAVKHGQIS
jgi:hypothetical protein